MKIFEIIPQLCSGGAERLLHAMGKSNDIFQIIYKVVPIMASLFLTNSFASEDSIAFI
mgnify:FL=1